GPGVEALSAYLQTLGVEQPAISVRTVITSRPDADLLNEWQEEGALEIRREAGMRTGRVLEPMPPFAGESSWLLEERAVYLITGGAGSLGLAFAEHIARRCHARLVLVGRSP